MRITLKFVLLFAGSLSLAATSPHVGNAQQDPVVIKIPASPPPPSESGDADQFYNDGCNAYRKGDFVAAAKCFTQAIAIKHKFSDANFNRALCYEALKDWKAALADMMVVVKVNPRMYDAYIERGRIYLKLKDFDAAAADFAKAIGIHAQKREAFEARGEAEYRQQKDAEAIADCTTAIDLDISDQVSLAHKYRGMAELRLGRKVEAVADLTPYVKAHPDDAEAAQALLDARQTTTSTP